MRRRRRRRDNSQGMGNDNSFCINFGNGRLRCRLLPC
jgi:hypothetical protein